MVRWLEHEGMDAGEFATAPVGFTAGTWPVWVTVCGGEANAADFILSMELGRLVRCDGSRLPGCSFVHEEQRELEHGVKVYVRVRRDALPCGTGWCP